MTDGRPALRIDRRELSGAFGDIGTDLPLLIGMILAAGLPAAGVFVTFGLLQWLTAWRYGIPMAVQPLKAVAVLVIAHRPPVETIWGAGVAIGLTMLVLTVSGTLDRIARLVPKAVVRGLQLGLGVQLAWIALREYVPAEGAAGLALAAVAGAIVVLLRHSRRVPPAMLVLGVGIVWAFVFRLDARDLAGHVAITLPAPGRLTMDALVTGALLLALPQLPLSLGNSVLATRQVAHDLFPERPVRIRELGFSYAAMNLLAPIAGGVPVCHGSGGLAGHHAFGARTAGSLVVYGAFYLLLGLGFAAGTDQLLTLIPLPALGVLLAAEGFVLARFARDLVPSPPALLLAVGVALCAVLVPYGYVVGMVAGTAVAHAARGSRLASS